MSDTAVIEAPKTESAPAAVEAPKMSSLMEAAAKDGFAPPELVEKVKAAPKQEVKPEVKVAEAAKPEAKVESKADAPIDLKGKKPWEAIEGSAKEETKTEAAKDEPEAIAPKGLDEKGAARWKELKQAEKELVSVKAELEKARTGQSDATIKELEALRAEKAEIEQLVAERRLETREDFKRDVITPINTATGEITKLINIGKIDKAAMDEAIRLPDRIERMEAIAKVLESTETPLRPMQETALYDAVERIHKAWQTEDTLRSQAREIETAATVKEQQKAALEAKAKEQEWSKANEAMFENLSGRIDLLKNPDIAKQVKESIYKPESPMDEAYNAHAAVILPLLEADRKKVIAELAEAKETIKAIRAAAPSTDGTPEKTAEQKSGGLSILEAARLDGLL